MYEINTLFFYHPLFMLELLVAESLFLHRLRLRKGLAWRIPLALLICFGSSFAVPTIQNVVVSVFSFLGMFFVTFWAAMLVFDADWVTLAFCCIAGFDLQRLSYERRRGAANRTRKRLPISSV